MFGPRVLSVFAIGLAVVAALPAEFTERPWPSPVTTITDEDIDDGTWFSFPLFGNAFAPLWRLFPTFSNMGPKIISDENSFKIVVNAKDYQKEDLKVKVIGFFVIIQGIHESRMDETDLFAGNFFHTYTLPANASGADVTAQLSSDGFLIVEAPINGKTKDKVEELDRDVPIKETGEPFQNEEQEPKNPFAGELATVTEGMETGMPFQIEKQEPKNPFAGEFATVNEGREPGVPFQIEEQEPKNPFAAEFATVNEGREPGEPFQNEEQEPKNPFSAGLTTVTEDRETGEPFQNEQQEPKNRFAAELTPVTEDTREQPTTTASQIVDVTDKENDIPHGVDVTV